VTKLRLVRGILPTRHHRAQTSPGTHPASYPVGTLGKTAVTSI